MACKGTAQHTWMKDWPSGKRRAFWRCYVCGKIRRARVLGK